MNPRISLVVVSCALSIVTGLAVSRTGRSGDVKPSGRRIRIGLSLDTLKEERWQHDRALFEKKAAELGADVLVQAANSDDTRQVTDVEALISRKVDVLVIVPHNGAAMALGVKKAHEAGIPVVSYDRLITGADPDLYISFDSAKVGETQARYLVDQLAKKGRLRVVRINGAKTDHNAVMIKEGQDRVLEPYVRKGVIKIIHEDWAENWKPENAKKIASAAITRFGHEFDAILAANDGTAGGAIQALIEEDLAGKILVTGQDAELAACQRIVNGTQSMTVYKPLKQLAERAAETALRMATGKPVVANAEVDNGQIKVPSIFLAVQTTTKDDMAATVIADGFHSAAEVYGANAPRSVSGKH